MVRVQPIHDRIGFGASILIITAHRENRDLAKSEKPCWGWAGIGRDRPCKDRLPVTRLPGYYRPNRTFTTKARRDALEL